MRQLASASEVADFLRGADLLDPAEEARIDPLPGGVSAVTYRVLTDRRRLVVKQPRAFLAVRDPWPASLGRARVEAAAMAYLHGLTPDSVSELVAYDPEEHVIVAACAPADWQEWRTVMLGGQVDVEVAAKLGRVLATWHASSRSDEQAWRSFSDLSGFVDLRIDPYFETTAQRRPEVARDLQACRDELLQVRRCLVHGDYAPKNVLVGRSGAWVVDFEVAHIGNPVFDFAFMLHHLVMKSIHLPQARPELRAAIHRFWEAYGREGSLGVTEADAVRHTGALLLARVFGKSPTAYLTDADKAVVTAVGTAAVRGAVGRLDDLVPVQAGSGGPGRSG